MRAVLLLVVAAVLGVGCVSPGAAVDPSSDEGPGAPAPEPASPARPAPRPAEPSPEPQEPARPSTPPEEEPTFCETEEGCTFWDEDFHEYALYQPDTLELDVLIVPSASADSGMDTYVMRTAVEAWAAGIAALAEPWFAEAFKMNVYVIGTDVPPQSALDDPEIVVVGAEYNPVLLFGIGLEPSQTACGAIGQEARVDHPAHAHDGMTILAADCVKAGFTCVAFNSNFLLGSPIYMQDLVAHEVGHCLGGGHVGDALDFSAKRVPVADIMSYQHDDEQVHCVSTLNVRVLEALYAPLAGETVPAPVVPGQYLTMPRPLYEQVPCENA